MAKKILKKKKTVKKIAKKPVQKINKKTAKKPAPKKIIKKIVEKKSAKKIVKKTIQKVLKKTAPVVKPASKKNIDYSKAVTPLGDRLVVRIAKPETMTAGGLYIPDMVNNAVGHLKGEVLAVGQGHTTKKGFLRLMDVKLGDQVLFADHAGTKVIFNSEELFIVNETDVLGVVSGSLQK